jgi:pimeloyl-ACP methyl ester carboxylesterase
MRVASAPVTSPAMPASTATPQLAPPSIEFPEIPGVSHHYVMVDGVRYHYAEAGEGEPLVLLHGFPQNWYMWREVMPELAKHYRVIAPDMRGAGWTEAPAGGYGKEQLADEIAHFMDAVGAPKARVMGHDWGGFVGFQLALRHPDKVSQYLALNIATPWPNEDARGELWKLAYQPILAAPLLGAALLRRKTFIKSMLWAASHVRPWSDIDVEMFAAPFRDRAHSQAGSAMYATFVAHELVPWLRGKYRTQRLEPETLLLVGEHDAVIRPSIIAGYERYSRDMRHEYIPGAGHFLAEERPDVVIDRALEFFGARSRR